jgi:hypothetical protein
MRDGKGLVFNNNIENWRFHRRIFKRAVTAMIRPSGQIILKNARNLIKHWAKLPKDHNQVRDLLDNSGNFCRASLWTSMTALTNFHLILLESWPLV